MVTKYIHCPTPSTVLGISIILQLESWSKLAVLLRQNQSNLLTCRPLHLLGRSLDNLRTTSSDLVASELLEDGMTHAVNSQHATDGVSVVGDIMRELHINLSYVHTQDIVLLSFSMYTTSSEFLSLKKKLPLEYIQLNITFNYPIMLQQIVHQYYSTTVGC